MRKSIIASFVLLTTLAFVGSSTAGPRRLKPDRDAKGCVELMLSVEPTEAYAGDTVLAEATVINCGTMGDYVTVMIYMAYSDSVGRYGDLSREISDTYFKLGPGEARSVRIKFMAPKMEGTYALVAEAKSRRGGADMAEVTLEILPYR